MIKFDYNKRQISKSRRGIFATSPTGADLCALFFVLCAVGRSTSKNKEQSKGLNTFFDVTQRDKVASVPLHQTSLD